MKAVILAGGEGTRLRPLTSNQPKPMMPLVNRPMLEHIISLLTRHGFDDVVVTVAYLANQIRDYFGDGSDFGVRMRYATEDEPLGTAGSVRNASAELDDTFLVISGDVLTDIDLSALVDAHRESGAIATIALKRVEDPLEFGIVITRPDGSIERFLEKPTWGQVFSDTINTGIYVLEPEVYDFIPEGQSRRLLRRCVPGHPRQGPPSARPRLRRLLGGRRHDRGVPPGPRRRARRPRAGRHPGLPDRRGHLAGGGRRGGPGRPGRRPGRHRRQLPRRGERPPLPVHGPRHRRRGEGRRLPRTRDLPRPRVRRAQHTPPRLHAGASTDIRSHARIEEGVVVGDECFIGEHAVINPGVKVYPFKTVEAGAVVNSSIVWESRGARTVFGRRGMRGLANVDITPEVVVRVAMAYGTSLPRGSVVTASRDTSRIARALKRAIIGGLNLAGANVEDLELATVPLTRFQVRNSQARGGVSVRLAPGDPDSVEIRFFDAEGRDIDAGGQRRIERLLHREDYRRAFAGDIGDITFPPRSIEFYAAGLERSVDEERIREYGFKVVLDYSNGAASIVMPTVLARLGIDVLAVNPYASTVAATSIDETNVRRRGSASSCARPGATSACSSTPTANSSTIIDDEGTVLSNHQALLTLVSLVAEATDGARIALPVAATREAELLAHDRARTSCGRRWPTPASWRPRPPSR